MLKSGGAQLTLNYKHWFTFLYIDSATPKRLDVHVFSWGVLMINSLLNRFQVKKSIRISSIVNFINLIKMRVGAPNLRPPATSLNQKTGRRLASLLVLWKLHYACDEMTSWFGSVWLSLYPCLWSHVFTEFIFIFRCLISWLSVTFHRHHVAFQLHFGYCCSISEMLALIG